MVEQILACLWSCCEASELALEVLSSLDMLELLTSFLVDPKIAMSSRKVAGQFLNTLSEENDGLLEIIRENAIQSTQIFTFLNTRQSGSSENDELYVLSCSILYNIRSTFSPEVILKLILAFLEEAIVCDIPAIAEKVRDASKQVDLAASSATPATSNLQDQDLIVPKNQHTDLLENTNGELVSLQLALELLANLFSEEIEEDSGDDMQGEQVAENEEEDEEADDFTDEMMEDVGLGQEEPANVSSGLLTPTLLARIFTLCQTHTFILESVSSRPFITNAQQVQTRALACVNNLFLIGAALPLARQNASDTALFWSSLFQGVQVTALCLPTPLELLEALITALWSISRTVVIVS